MGRGFVKENDQEETPLVPPRADLPNGVPNYMTPNGMNELLAEKQAMINEKGSLEATTEKDKRIASNYITAKLYLLEERIATAKVMVLDKQPKDEIRFGATVTLKIGKSIKLQNYQIVGVDESDISQGKISFISPIACILIGKKVGEQATLKLARENRTFEIIKIIY